MDNNTVHWGHWQDQSSEGRPGTPEGGKPSPAFVGSALSLPHLPATCGPGKELDQGAATGGLPLPENRGTNGMELHMGCYINR